MFKVLKPIFCSIVLFFGMQSGAAPLRRLTILLDFEGVSGYFTQTALPACLMKQIKKYIFTFLEHAQPYRTTDICAREGSGLRMPSVMCDWQKGLKSSAEIKDLMMQAATNNKKLYTVERAVLLALIKKMFTSEQVVASQTLNPEVINFVKYCKDHGHKVILASNFPKYEFDLLYQKYPDFFDALDGQHVSGQVGSMKPEQEFLRQICDIYDLKPEECVLIDDRPENRKSARTFGMQSIWPHTTTWAWNDSYKVTDFNACIQYIETLSPVFLADGLPAAVMP